ncbi:MAG: hypothetical protein AABZ06_07170 [Bdellovibrionota bacterium]
MNKILYRQFSVALVTSVVLIALVVASITGYCRAVLAAPPEAVSCVVNILAEIITDQSRSERALKIESKATRVSKQTNLIQKFLGRRFNNNEFQRSRLVAFIKHSLGFDRRFIVQNYLEPLFKDMTLSHQTIQVNQRMRARLIEALKQIKSNNLSAKDLMLPAELSVEGQILKQAIASGDQAQIISAIGKVIKLLDTRSVESAKSISKNYEQYSAALGFLKSAAQHGDNIGLAAKDVLEHFNPERLLAGYFNRAGLPVPKEPPSLGDLKAILIEFPEAELTRLKRIRNGEMVSLLAQLSPTESLFRLIDSGLSQIPGVNHSKFRAFFKTVQDEKLQILYYPDIERISASQANSGEKFKLLRELNAGTNDEFMTLFARRADLRDLWFELVDAAKKDRDKFFYKKMLTAQENASRMDDLSATHDISNARIVARSIDALAATATGYWMIKNDQDTESELDRHANDMEKILETAEKK